MIDSPLCAENTWICQGTISPVHNIKSKNKRKITSNERKIFNVRTQNKKLEIKEI
jgi:hypothetical protein